MIDMHNIISKVMRHSELGTFQKFIKRSGHQKASIGLKHQDLANQQNTMDTFAVKLNIKTCLSHFELALRLAKPY